MGTPTISQKRYLEAAQIFHWATQEHFTMWFTGDVKRSKRTEAILPRLVKRGLLVSARHGKKMVYTCPRRVRHPGFYLKVDHGLGCTEGLIRFWWSDMQAEIIPERMFYGCGSVPEWGLRYDTGKMILYEYCTADNFSRMNIMKAKLASYALHLESINKRFHSEGIVVFVCDVPREKVEKFACENFNPDISVSFTDEQTFCSVPIRQQLTAPIYIWGKDGSSHPLVNHAQPAYA